MLRKILASIAFAAVMTAGTAYAQDKTVDQTSVSAQELIGVKVVDTQKQEIGAVSDIILGAGEDNVKAFIVNLTGEETGKKQMAFAATGLDIYKNQQGELTVYSNVTREMLEAMPAYDKASFTKDPDSVLVK
ncbi:PRC-barrel domain containing protein [Rhodobacterales bacterium]|nr:PRC-barrel domain containing protein [Rhodobacterales bacterium]